MSTVEENYTRELNDAILEYGSSEKKNDDDILAIHSNVYIPAHIIRGIILGYVYDHFSAEIIFDSISANMTAWKFDAPPPKIKRDDIIPEVQLMKIFDSKNRLNRK